MLIDKNKKRLNAHARIVLHDGTISTDLYDHRDKWEENTITEIDDPQWPAGEGPETHIWNDLDDAPYFKTTPRDAQEVINAHNARIDAQIRALEGGYPLARYDRETKILDALEKAASLGITEEQLLDPNSEHFAPGFARLVAYDLQITELRRSRK